MFLKTKQNKHINEHKQGQKEREWVKIPAERQVVYVFSRLKKTESSACTGIIWLRVCLAMQETAKLSSEISLFILTRNK